MSEGSVQKTLDDLKLSSPVQEHHIDFLLEEEFACNPDFLAYFVEAASAGVSKCLADGVTTEIPRPHETAMCRAIRSVTTEAGESDVLAIYTGVEPSASRVAVLIEDKIRASFQKDQAERYRERGEAGLNRMWDKYWTCLVCPDKYAGGSAGFDARVSLEQLRAFFERSEDSRSKFKARVFGRAIERFSASGVQVLDEVMTAFRSFYAKLAEDHFRGGEIIWDRPRDAWWGDYWFVFRSPSLPRGSSITHKTREGTVHLSFPNTDAKDLGAACERIPPRDRLPVKQTSKSASIEIAVNGISDYRSPSNNASSIGAAFVAVDRLYRYWKDHRAILEDMPKLSRTDTLLHRTGRHGSWAESGIWWASSQNGRPGAVHTDHLQTDVGLRDLDNCEVTRT
jgi:hypothetical protein